MLEEPALELAQLELVQPRAGAVAEQCRTS